MGILNGKRKSLNENKLMESLKQDGEEKKYKKSLKVSP